MTSEGEITALLDRFDDTFPEETLNQSLLIPVDRPHVRVPIAAIPQHETIAMEFFSPRPEAASEVRKWMSQNANNWDLYESWAADVELLSSEGITNGWRYGRPRSKATRALPVEIGIVTEPSHEGNLVAAFGDWRYNLVKNSVASNSSRGLDIASELSVQTGFARPAILTGVNGQHPVEVDKAYWFEVGPKVPEVTVYQIPRMRKHH